MDQAHFAERVAHECDGFPGRLSGTFLHAPGRGGADGTFAVLTIAGELFHASDDAGKPRDFKTERFTSKAIWEPRTDSLEIRVGKLILRNTQGGWSLNGTETHVHNGPSSGCPA